MRKCLALAVLAAVPMSSVPSLASCPESPSITVSATTTAHPDTVTARIVVCPDAEDTHCYRILRRVQRGETAKLDSFLSLKTTPFPSLLGELSITADGESLDYRLEFVAGVLPVTSVAGSVPLTTE